MQEERFIKTSARIALALCLAVHGAGAGRAASVTWDGSTDMNWTQPDSTGWGGLTYTNGDAVSFLGAGTGTVAIVGTVNPGSVVVDGTDNYTFAGGGIAGGATLTKIGSGILTLSGNNTYSGLTLVTSNGVLDVGTIGGGGLSANSGLYLGGTNTGSLVFGILQGNGTFTRSLGGTATPNGTQLGAKSGGFAARGGDLTVNFGGSSNQISLNSGGHVFGDNFMFGSSTADGRVTVVNPINLNSLGGQRVFTVTSGIGGDAATSAELRGQLSQHPQGSGIIKKGDGMLILSNTNNSYGGRTTIENGTLSAASIGNVNGGNSALGAPTNAASGTLSIGLSTNTGRLLYTGGGDTTDRAVNLAGTTGGAILDQSGTGLLKFTTNVTATGAGSKTLTLQGSTAGTGEIAGSIVDNSGANKTSLTKTGTGTWMLSGSNTYSGLTVVTGNGVLDVGTIGSGGLSANSGLFLGSTNAASGTYGILQGNGAFTRSLASGTTNPGASQVGGAAGGFAARGGDLTVNFGGAGGQIQLNQSGYTFGNNLIFGSSNADSRVVLVNPIELNTTSLRTITVNSGIGGAAATAAELQGRLSDGSLGSSSLRKLGDGTLILSGSNTYSGQTLVNFGALHVNGTHIGGSNYIVSSGATLGGTGLIGSAIDVLNGGIVAPGNSIGALITSNDFTLDGTLQIELENLLGQARGSSDLLDVNGTFDITGGTLQFSYSGTLSNDFYVFAEYDTLTGTFAPMTLPDGYGIDYAFNYLGNSNHIALVIPEPSTFALFGLGALALFGFCRRRGRV